MRQRRSGLIDPRLLELDTAQDSIGRRALFKRGILDGNFSSVFRATHELGSATANENTISEARLHLNTLPGHHLPQTVSLLPPQHLVAALHLRR